VYTPDQLKAIGIDGRLRDLYRQVFLDAKGAPNEVLQDFERRFHMFNPLTDKGGDPYRSAFHDGQRTVVTHIIGVCALRPGEVVRQVLEDKENP
jgi:hypothetical protein